MQDAAQSPSSNDHWWPSPPPLILVISSFISVVVLGRQCFSRHVLRYAAKAAWYWIALESEKNSAVSSSLGTDIIRTFS
ncbi:hypothetical protein ARMGADRAFT_1015169 [Armillaria gallica]|uniref:Uncharacterized protein n=1 Tax=Armillaria gallica TaxID=47427 RepID=A0A2H3D2R7_ARMGA|nr:hypothetical protein ARMGADRAFT_1015169 [Armillaria gallica]